MSERLGDIGGHDLGAPAQIVAIRGKDDLRAALELARSAGRPLVATGLRASYWHNLWLDGAVVADLTAFDRVLATEPRDGYVTVQAGVPVRALDRHLRAHGGHLAMHPDASGDTPIGASFANGTTAGVGMLWGSFADQVLGLEVMLADGGALQIGASRALRGAGGAIGAGLPDLRSLFFGAEGAAGIVTELDLALVPAPWEARLGFTIDRDGFEDVVAAGRHWRRRGCVETMRYVWTDRGQLDVTVASRVGPEELPARVDAFRATLPGWPAPRVEIATEAERRGDLPDHDRRWPGPPGSTWARARARPFAGIDALVPYGRSTEAWAWARAVVPPGRPERRLAAYVGRDGVNLGIHCAFQDTAARDRGRADLESRLGELAAFDAVPYRPGLVWMPALRERWDGRTLSALRAVAAALDPEHRLPGAGLLGAPGRPRP